MNYHFKQNLNGKIFLEIRELAILRKGNKMISEIRELSAMLAMPVAKLRLSYKGILEIR